MSTRRRPTRGMLVVAIIGLMLACDPPEFPDFPTFPGCVPDKLYKLDLEKRKELKLLPLDPVPDPKLLKLGLSPFRDPDIAGKPPKDRRLSFTSRATNAGGYAFLERTFAGAFDTRVTVAYDSRKGFDEVFGSGASLRVEHLAAEPAMLYEIQAQVLPKTETLGDTDDVAVYVFDQDHLGGDLADPLVLRDVHQVDLRLSHIGADVVYQARPRSGTDEAPPEWTTIATVTAGAPGDDSWRLGLGAFGLSKGGRMLFDGMSLAGDALVSGLELDLAGDVLQFGAELQAFHDALVAVAEGDLVAWLDELCDETLALQDATAAALDDDALPAGDAAEIALKTLAKLKKKLVKAAKRLPAALAVLDEQGSDKKLQAVIKLVEQAIDCNCVLMANLAGLRVHRASDIPLVPLEDGED